MRLNPKILTLSIAHILVGIVCCVLVAAVPRTPAIRDGLRVVALIALMLSQAFLVGLYMALSGANLWLRLLALGVATVYLESLLAFAAGQQGVQWLVAVTSLATAGILLAARQWGSQLRRVTNDASRVAPNSYQFKIQGLMIVTVVLALLFAGAKGVRTHISPIPHSAGRVQFVQCRHECCSRLGRPRGRFAHQAVARRASRFAGARIVVLVQRPFSRIGDLLEYHRLPADSGSGQLRLVARRPILRIPPDPLGSLGHRVFERAIRRD